MYDLKTSAFGGYNKKQADALISRLKDQIENLTAEEERLQSQLNEANIKVSENKTDVLKAQNKMLLDQNRTLSERSSALIEENLKLQSEVMALKNAALSHKISEQRAAEEERKSKNHRIKAYADGHDILQQSLMLSDTFFKDVQEIYKNAELSAAKAIDEYETIGEEIEVLLSYINSHITCVRDETEDLIQKARAVSSMMARIDAVKQTARLHARKKVNEYEKTAAEFIQSSDAETDMASKEPASVQGGSEESDEEPQTAPMTHGNAEPSEPDSGKIFPIENAAAAKKMTVSESKEERSSFTQYGHRSRISSEERERLIKQVLSSQNTN